MFEELSQAVLEPGRMLAWLGRMALVAFAYWLGYVAIQAWKRANLRDGNESNLELAPRRAVQWMWSIISIVVALAITAFSLKITHFELLYELGLEIATYFSSRVASMAGILAASWAAYWLVGTIASWITPSDEFTRSSVRVESLRGIIASALRFFIVMTTVAAVLSSLGVNVSALLAGASVVGLAISFGAQSLIKDVITGFFILLEDQYGVGDVVRVNGAGGLAGGVESLSLRVTVLRDLEGTSHVIPNGEIKTVSVLSKEWSRAVADVEVPYDTNLDKAIALLTQVANNLFTDSVWSEKFLEEPEIMGVQNINGSSITLRALFKVLPKEQWDVAREFKRRMKNALDAAGVRAPLPQMNLTMASAGLTSGGVDVPAMSSPEIVKPEPSK